MARRIIHVDMDEFFAAVEKLDRPELRGKCLLIGGSAEARGVVSTASYEAREFGCGSAMPMAVAKRRCPQAIILPVRGDRYREISEQIFEIFQQFTPLVEPLSIDEAFLDVSGCERLFGSAEKIAVEVKRRIRERIGLTASVGVAPNKFLAKLASDLRKPDGLVVITAENVHEVLDPLAVSKLWGVGPAAQKQFERLNIQTIGRLRAAPPEMISQVLGEMGEHFQRLARGEDDRPVTPDSEAKSVSQERTFAQDVVYLEELRRVLSEQTRQVARRLRRNDLLARTITVKMRYGDFTTITRSVTLSEAVDVTEDLLQAARGLLEKWAKGSFRPLRLLGVGASGLVGKGGRQLSLFESSRRSKQRRLDQTLDRIAERFGGGAVRHGDSEDE